MQVWQGCLAVGISAGAAAVLAHWMEGRLIRRLAWLELKLQNLMDKGATHETEA